jgi:hypothetical protein
MEIRGGGGDVNSKVEESVLLSYGILLGAFFRHCDAQVMNRDP